MTRNDTDTVPDTYHLDATGHHPSTDDELPLDRDAREWKIAFAAERLAARLRTEEAWQAAAQAMEANEAAHMAKLNAIHRDIRKLGNMIVDFAARLEAMEKKQQHDLSQEWDV